MTASDWRPSNQVERDMLTAMEAGDERRYAQLLAAAPLYLPTDDDGTELKWPATQGLDPDHVLVFTSRMSLFQQLAGPAKGVRERTFGALRRRDPDPDVQLLINPGTPISVLLTAAGVDSLMSGAAKLAASADLRTVLDFLDGGSEQADADFAAGSAELALAQLGAGPNVAAQVASAVTPNAFEQGLLRAVGAQDFDTYLLTLLRAEALHVPTTRKVRRTRAGGKRGTPWLVLGDAYGPVIPAFSSAEVRALLAPGLRHGVRISTLNLLAAWPGPEHTLAFNPGLSTGYTLPGSLVTALRATLS